MREAGTPNVMLAGIVIPVKQWPGAACKNYPVAMFYPQKGEDVAKPKAVCKTCALKHDCLEWAITHGEHFGIWGGTSERERKRIRAKRNPLPRVVKTIQHGTDAGYRMHHRRGIPVCVQCARAHSTAVQEGKVRRRAVRWEDRDAHEGRLA